MSGQRHDGVDCLRAIGALIAAVFWETDPRLVVTAASGSALAPAGLTGASLVGRDLRALPDGPEARTLIEAHARALSGGEASFEIEWGSRVFSAHCERSPSGGVRGVAVDITERRRFAQSLALSKRACAALEEAGSMVASTGAVLEAIGRTLRFDCVELWSETQGSLRRVKRWADEGWGDVSLEAQARRVTTTRRSEWIVSPPATCTVPFVSKDVLHGVVVCARRGSDPEDPAIIAILENLGSTMAQILEKIRAADLGSEQRYRALIENSLDAVMVLGADGKRIYVSSAQERILGRRPNTEVGTSAFEQVHPDDLAGARDVLTNLLRVRGSSARVTVRVRHADGEYRWLEGLASNHLDTPGVRGIVVNYRDVTQQKLAEDALVEANAALERRVAERTAELRAEVARHRETTVALSRTLSELQDLYDNALCGYHSLDSQGRYLRVNLRELAWLGYTEEELVGRQFREIVAPESWLDLERGYATLHERGMVDGVELALLKKDGTRLLVLCSATAIHDDSGAYVSCRATFLDLTERRRAEQQARALLASQAHATRLSTLGAMASGLAHELNQPLTAISVYARASARRVGAGQIDVVELQESLEKITRQAERAGEAIRRLRAFVTNWEPRRANVEVNDLIREALALFESELRSSGTELELELAPGLPRVEVDRMQIEQVLLNLVRNGIEAMADVHNRQRVLRISSRSSARGVEVSIADAGTGIAPEIAARLFHPFQTTRRGGLGLSLAVSRSIVDAHGGDLRAETSTRDGTSFVLALPTHGLR